MVELNKRELAVVSGGDPLGVVCWWMGIVVTGVAYVTAAPAVPAIVLGASFGTLLTVETSTVARPTAYTESTDYQYFMNNRNDHFK